MELWQKRVAFFVVPVLIASAFLSLLFVGIDQGDKWMMGGAAALFAVCVGVVVVLHLHAGRRVEARGEEAT